MIYYNSALKNALNKTPRLKKAIKTLFNGVLRRQEKRRIAEYNEWIRQFDIDDTAIKNQRRESEVLGYRPLISIITPTYNTPEAYFREMIKSVQSQTYSNWELVLVDDASSNEDVREWIKQYAKDDNRIKYLFLTKNHHIAGATNEAIKIASGEFISLFDHDDVLCPDVLFEIVKALNDNKKLDFIYTDEDKITEGLESRQEPFFKPDWNPDFLHSVNYITHFTTIRKTALDRIGYEDGKYNGAQDWELFLRVTRNIPEENIYHIPKILYHWRIHDASTAKSFSTKPYVVEAQRKAIEADLQVRGYTHTHVRQDEVFPGQWQVIFTPASSTAKVSIAVVGQSKRMVQHIQERMRYKNVEIMSVKSDATYNEILTKTSGDYLVIIDKPVNIQASDWIDVMLGDAERGDIGFVATWHNNETITENIQTLIGKSAASFASKLSQKALTKHLYTTTRYNIPQVKAGVVMVEVRKLRAVLSDKEALLDLGRVSNEMTIHDYKNLYNPYVKVVK